MLLLSLATVLGTAGCYQGEGRTVTSQRPSGNGTTFTVSDQIEVQGLTVVTDGQGHGSVVMTIVNSGDEADALLTLGTDPATTLTVSRPTSTATASPEAGASAEPQELVDVPAEQTVHIGAPGSTRITLADLKTPAGSYVAVALAFVRAGSTHHQVLVAPDTGFYADYGPTASASPSPTSAPSPSTSGEGTVAPLPNATAQSPSVSTGPAQSPSATP